MKRALVLSLAVVLGLGIASFAQTLSGAWETYITIDPAGPTIELDSTLTVTYALSGWAFTSETTIDETGWLDQVFSATGALGAFTLGSTLDFDPITPAFESWEVTTGLSIAGVAFSGTFTLVPGDVEVILVGSGTAGLVTLEVEITFGAVGGGCDFDWAGIVISGSFPFCCADVGFELELDCDGFEQICFTATGIEIPGIAFATLDAELCYTVQTKTLVVEPSFDFGGDACFEIYLTDPAGGLLFGDIEVVGLGLSCTIGGVEFYGLSYWGAAGKPTILGDYWEMYQISTTDDGCCGPFAFDIAVYFLEGGARLFDVSYLEANMEIQLASQFTFAMGIEIDFEVGGFTNWVLGFIVTW
ncbi:MAG: hypothetical protein AB1778_10065 [Candidatus Bipolaricaulota bacterium]